MVKALEEDRRVVGLRRGERQHVALNEREVGRDRAPLAYERAELLADLDRSDMETGSDEIVGQVAPSGTELDDACRRRETERVFAEAAQHVTARGEVVADHPRRSGLEGKWSNDCPLQVERRVFVRGRVVGATGDPLGRAAMSTLGTQPRTDHPAGRREPAAPTVRGSRAPRPRTSRTASIPSTAQSRDVRGRRGAVPAHRASFGRVAAWKRARRPRRSGRFA